MIDARKDADSLRLKHCRQPVERCRDGMCTWQGDHAILSHGYSAAARFNRSENVLRNLVTFGATTAWQ
jgi:hypothetical protein